MGQLAAQEVPGPLAGRARCDDPNASQPSWVWGAFDARWQAMYQWVLQEAVGGRRLPTEREGQMGSWVASQLRAYVAFE